MIVARSTGACPYGTEHKTLKGARDQYIGRHKTSCLRFVPLTVAVGILNAEAVRPTARPHSYGIRAMRRRENSVATAVAI